MHTEHQVCAQRKTAVLGEMVEQCFRQDCSSVARVLIPKQVWECLPAISALGRYRQEDQGLKVILGYIASLRPVWAARDAV